MHAYGDGRVTPNWVFAPIGRGKCFYPNSLTTIFFIWPTPGNFLGNPDDSGVEHCEKQWFNRRSLKTTAAAVAAEWDSRKTWRSLPNTTTITTTHPLPPDERGHHVHGSRTRTAEVAANVIKSVAPVRGVISVLTESNVLGSRVQGLLSSAPIHVFRFSVTISPSV